MNQRIVCAANKNPDGTIVLGVRHYDWHMRQQKTHLLAEQGFIDNNGNFLTREQAWIVAMKENQVIRRVGGDEGCLYSENLY